MRFAYDTHIHFYDHHHPVAPAATIRPPDATPEDYRAVQTTLGTERIVVVQPTTYGLDNTCQLTAMAAFGDSARGVMVVDADTASDELTRLTDLGVRGARFHMLPGGAVAWEMLEAVAAKIQPLGWHVQLQLNGRELPRLVDRLLRLPVDLVVDHVGRFMPVVETDSAEFAALLTLIDHGATVKLSAPYESSDTGPPAFDDVTRLVDALGVIRTGPLAVGQQLAPSRSDEPTDCGRARRTARSLVTDRRTSETSARGQPRRDLRLLTTKGP